MQVKLSRRDFIHAGCASTAITLAPHWLDVAEARFPRGAVPSSGFNGGRSQLNLNFLQYSGDFPFLNKYKNSSDTSYGDNSGVPDPTELDDDGYPHTISHGGVYRLFFDELLSDRGGPRVLKWAGVGTMGGVSGTIPPSTSFTGSAATGVLDVATTPTNPIVKGQWFDDTSGYIGTQLSGTPGGVGRYMLEGYSGTKSSGTLTTNSGSLTNSVEGRGRLVIIPNTSRIPLLISSFTTKITNVVFCHADDESRLAAGQIFGVKFKERIIEGNFRDIRSMDWMNNNTNHQSKWLDRRALSSATYAGPDISGRWAVASPTQSSYTFDCDAPSGFIKANRDKVRFKFPSSISGTNDGSQQYLLDVNGTGAHPVFDEFCRVNPYIPPGGHVVLTFVEELGAYLMQIGFVNGCPYELVLTLCAEVGANPWFNLPVLAGDAPTGADYFATGLATLCRNFKTTHGLSWMCDILEGPNECWNQTGSVIIVWICRRVQWKMNGGIPHYPANGNNPDISEGPGAVTLLTIPSLTAGTGYADVTFSAPPTTLKIGSQLIPRSFDSNGTTNFDFRPVYVTALNVGGNANKVTVKIPSAVGGSYDGSGAYFVPNQWDEHNYYGRVISKAIAAWVAVYGDSGAGRDINYRFVIGVQTGYGTSSQGGAATERFEAPQWVIQGGQSPSPSDGGYATHTAVANYWTPHDIYKFEEVRGAFGYYFTYKDDPVGQAAIVADYVDSSGDPAATSGGPGIPKVQAILDGWKTYCKTKGLKICFYEGGHSPDYAAVSWTAANTWGPISFVTAATQANPCVVTLPNTATHNSLQTGDTTKKWAGQGCVAGMQLNFFDCTMTQLNSGGPATLRSDNGHPGGLSFAGATQNIGWNTASVPLINQSVSITLDGSPWPFSTIEKGELYYVVARDATNKWIRISATKGGSPITVPESPTFEDIWAAAGWRVLSVDDGTNQVTLDCDATSFTAFSATPGTPELQRAVYDRGDTIVNVLRDRSKHCASTPTYPSTGLGGWLTKQYTDILAMNVGEAWFRAESPSMFTLSCERPAFSYREHDSQIWGVLVNIYQYPPPPQWSAVVAFNH